MLKIDVEGAELEVLKGAKELLSGETAPTICFEYGVPKMDEGVFSYLKNVNDYHFFCLRKGNQVADMLIPIKTKKKLEPGINIFAFLASHYSRLPELSEYFSVTKNT